MLKVRLLTEHAQPPVRATEGAAGLDLHAALRSPLTINPNRRQLVPTGLSLELPEGTYGRIAPRSGLAFRHGLMTMAGVIDRDYTGEVKVLLHNAGSNPVHLRPGDRIAQLILENYVVPTHVVVERGPVADGNGRGANGFGSTGE